MSTATVRWCLRLTTQGRAICFSKAPRDFSPAGRKEQPQLGHCSRSTLSSDKARPANLSTSSGTARCRKHTTKQRGLISQRAQPSLHERDSRLISAGRHITTRLPWTPLQASCVKQAFRRAFSAALFFLVPLIPSSLARASRSRGDRTQFSSISK